MYANNFFVYTTFLEAVQSFVYISIIYFYILFTPNLLSSLFGNYFVIYVNLMT